MLKIVSQRGGGWCPRRQPSPDGSAGPGEAEPGVVGGNHGGPPGDHGDLLKVHPELPVAQPVDLLRQELCPQVSKPWDQA